MTNQSIILYRPKQVCEKLNLSQASLYRYVRAGVLRPCMSLGKLYFNDKSIQDFVKTTRKGKK